MFNIGEKVIIVGPPEGKACYCYYDGKGYGFTPGMVQYIALSATVIDTHRNLPNAYYLDCAPGYYWHESWLMPMKEYTIEEDELISIFK